MKIQTSKLKEVMIKFDCDVFAKDETHPFWCACRGTGEFLIKTFVPAETGRDEGRDDPPLSN